MKGRERLARTGTAVCLSRDARYHYLRASTARYLPPNVFGVTHSIVPGTIFNGDVGSCRFVNVLCLVGIVEICRMIKIQ